MSGCQSTNESKAATHDPLMGEKVPEQPFGVAGPPPPPQNRAGMGGPSPPQATASKSNAAMLIADPLNGAKPLNIPESSQTQQNQGPGGWQVKDPLPTNPTGGSGVILRTPEPVPITPVPPPVIGPNGPPGSAAAAPPVPVVPVPAVPVPVASAPAVPVVSPVSYTDPDPYQKALNDRGVIWQDQKQVANGVQFTCRVASKQDPNFIRVYEATARDYPSAVQAVLAQIDQQR